MGSQAHGCSVCPRQALLATNHIDDAGAIGIKLTLATLKKNGITAIGLNTSSKPELGGENGVVIQVRGMKVGIFAFCDVETCVRQTKRYGWGPALLDSRAMRSIAALRSSVDILIVSIHSGGEYTTVVSDARRATADSLAALGVDIILGHHAHVPQSHTQIGRSFAAFGLSNFVFDSHVCRNPQTGELTNETMAASPGCRRLQPADRARMAELTRRTRIYRIDVEAKTGVIAAAYLPCAIASEPGAPLYRPVPTRPHRWIAACGVNDSNCAPCS
jgi:poly-gamma-glutamate capsule biosynthesis protein CapA/YwtB (metallophosphatase superfamily)